MFRLIFLFKKYNFFLFFLFLEALAIFIISSNTYHHSVINKATQEVSGNFHQCLTDVHNYFHLKQMNDSLLQENSELRTIINKPKSLKNRINIDTNYSYGYIFYPVHIINNSVINQKNYITLDVGKNDAVKNFVGVVSDNGIVGVLNNVSNNFSVAISILNTDFRVNAKIKENNEVGSLKWNGKSAYNVILEDIPSHIELKKGQNVVVGPYSKLFPENYPIGKIIDFEKGQSGFYKITVKLNNNMKSITSAYLIEKVQIKEQNELENSINKQNE